MFYILFTALCILKVQNIYTYYSLEMFVNEGFLSKDYYEGAKKYFDSGLRQTIYIDRQDPEQDIEMV